MFSPQGVQFILPNTVQAILPKSVQFIFLLTAAKNGARLVKKKA